MKKEEYIKKCKLKHKNKYSECYKKLPEEINLELEWNFDCPEHGNFPQKFKNHLRHGCKKCAGNKTKTKEEFINDARKIYGNKYDYSRIDYKNNKERVNIICPKHGDFKKSYQEHIRLKQGCPKCSRVTDKESYIEKANEIHNFKYDYSKFEYKGCRDIVKIICPKHGDFTLISYSHLNGIGCPKCKSSKGELTIEKFLDENKVNYESQKHFEDCKNINTLPFDFYLPEYNLCIEFDGKQHFDKNSIYYSDSIVKNDKIKTNYCRDKNIDLLRISYKEINKINKILENKL